jgi:S1-C subfamily serine protease
VTHKRFKKFWNFVRLYLVLRELKRNSRKRPPIGPTFVYTALALLTFACAPSAPLRDPIVVVMRDGLPTCSGFAVAQNQVVTAAHCVTDMFDVEIVTAEQWQYTSNASTPAHVQYVDRQRDLAALSTEFNFDTKVTYREPIDGETVYARSVFFGAIADGNILPGIGFFRDTTISIDFGWSGSPVFGLDGKVVGFVDACRVGSGRPRAKCLPESALIGVLP